MDKIIKKYIGENFEGRKEGNAVIFQVSASEIKSVCKKLHNIHKLDLKTITATDERQQNGGFLIFYVFGAPEEHAFLVPCIILKDTEEFPTVTEIIHGASGYERRIKTFFGLEPMGHPAPRPILLHENWPEGAYPLRKDFIWNFRPEGGSLPYQFQKVEGEGIYEIPVGPVHAGIIEPGHFRFSVAGEEIILLEPKLGYKHKGIEKLFEVLPMAEKLKLSERVSGDTSFTHSLAFCQAVENLADLEVLERAKYLRVIFSELERLANHLNDIGFIMLDTGYSFGGSNCARLREVVMQWHERLSGSRYLRGVNVVGGVTKDIDQEVAKGFLQFLQKLQKDFDEVIEISENSSSVLNRLQSTGRLDLQTAIDHGVMGVAGRALGIEHDARIEFSYAAYDKLKFEMALENEGDVCARFYVRVKEVYSSINILEQALNNLPTGKIKSEDEVVLRKNSLAVGITEAWRGEVVYLVITDASGNISRVDVRDPSFVNWTVLGHAGKGNIIPDFPLINKSFNLSYSGNDL
jgi:Ni,Fe-hydrogenase III large subunit/Ni,Fe-hydrogenase III component G